VDLCQNDLSDTMHAELDSMHSEPPIIIHLHAGTPGQEAADDIPDNGQGFEGDDFEEACSPPDDLQEANPTATVQRMLGIIEDQDDIAFDNATWYLNSQPDLAHELWSMALESNDETAQVRCLEIFRQVVQQTTASQVIIGLDEAGLPLQIRSTYTHLPQVVAMLSKAPETNAKLTTTFGVVEERFGLLRARALDLLVDLIETRNSTICEQIAELDALPIVFEKFFVYAWNSALHSTVLRMVEYVFDVEETTAMVKLQRRLLEPSPRGCSFLTRLMDAYESTTPQVVEVKELDMPPIENQEPIDHDSAAVEQKLVVASKSVGYMSAVVEMALAFREASKTLAVREMIDEIQEAQSEGNEAARWEMFCVDVLDRLEDVSPEKRCLGGEKPRPNPTCGQQ